MNPVLRRACATALLAGLLPLALSAQPATNVEAGSGYQLPVPALQALVDAPRPPQASLSPRRDLLAFIETPSLPGIDVVAQEELRLAGMRIHPHTWSRSAFSFGTGLSLRAVDGGQERPVQGLPEKPAIASIAWSPDQRHLAFSHVDTAAGEVQSEIEEIAAETKERLGDESPTVYHEVDEGMYSATSDTFIGQVYSELGLTNIADQAEGAAESGGYPQLSPEFIVEENPDLIFVAYPGDDAVSELKKRDAFDTVTAVKEDGVVQFDEDIASRWGPRIVDLAQSVSDAALAAQGA